MAIVFNWMLQVDLFVQRCLQFLQLSFCFPHFKVLLTDDFILLVLQVLFADVVLLQVMINNWQFAWLFAILLEQNKAYHSRP